MTDSFCFFSLRTPRCFGHNTPDVFNVCPVSFLLDKLGRALLVRASTDLAGSATNVALVVVRAVIVAVTSARALVKVTSVDACALMIFNLETAAYASISNELLMPITISLWASSFASVLMYASVFANSSWSVPKYFCISMMSLST